jgi:hypothetical protein
MMKCLWGVIQGNIPRRKMRRKGEAVVAEIGGGASIGHDILAAHPAVVLHLLATQGDATQVHARGIGIVAGNLIVVVLLSE